MATVIQVERELARVRGEVEQMQGRLRYLANRTELSTVTLIIRKRQEDFVPPPEPTFLTEIQRTWGTSLSLLQELGQRLADLAIDIMGPYGHVEYSKWSPLGGSMIDLYQSSIGFNICAGSNEIQRNIIAWVGAGLPRFK